MEERGRGSGGGFFVIAKALSKNGSLSNVGHGKLLTAGVMISWRVFFRGENSISEAVLSFFLLCEDTFLFLHLPTENFTVCKNCTISGLRVKNGYTDPAVKSRLQITTVQRRCHFQVFLNRTCLHPLLL